MSEYGKVGLVLSGGGAKGAYQVGVLNALVEFNIPVHVIAGASIGSLNGAVLACAPSLSEGAKRLDEIWRELGNDSPLKQQVPSYFRFLYMAGLRESAVLGLFHAIVSTAQHLGVSLPDKVHDCLHGGMMSDKPLQALLDRYIDDAALSQGLPLYVSVFRSMGGVLDILRVLMAELRFWESRDSEFIHLQSKPIAEQREFLLASAAIPIAFAPRQINGSIYSDGGQGGWTKAQGNTPIKPLLDQGCDLVIVTHLSDGSLWSCHDFPETTIIEIRPQSSIARNTGIAGGFKDLLGFDAGQIDSWITQGYRDTKHCIEQIIQASKARQHLRQSEKTLAASELNNIHADAALNDAMSRLV
jgi:NTE family protein